MNLPTAMSGAVYNDHNQLTQWNGASYNHDENGNLTSDGARNFSWNARNQLTQITGGSTSAQFSYDAWGRRTRKLVNSAATKYLYDSSNTLQELNEDNSVRASFLPGFGLDEMFGRTRGSVKTEYLTDRLGSTIALADSNGNLVTNYSYEAYGKMTPGGAADDNARTFTGRDDDGTGLMYYRARYYDPASGRFIAEDPLGPSGGDFNLYSYVGDDPVNSVDPTGQYITWTHEAILWDTFGWRLPDSDLEALVQANHDIDWAPGARDPWNQYKHGLHAPGRVSKWPATCTRISWRGNSIELWN